MDELISQYEINIQNQWTYRQSISLEHVVGCSHLPTHDPVVGAKRRKTTRAAFLGIQVVFDSICEIWFSKGQVFVQSPLSRSKSKWYPQVPAWSHLPMPILLRESWYSWYILIFFSEAINVVLPCVLTSIAHSTHILLDSSLNGVG